MIKAGLLFLMYKTRRIKSSPFTHRSLGEGGLRGRTKVKANGDWILNQVQNDKVVLKIVIVIFMLLIDFFFDDSTEITLLNCLTLIKLLF